MDYLPPVLTREFCWRLIVWKDGERRACVARPPGYRWEAGVAHVTGARIVLPPKTCLQTDCGVRIHRQAPVAVVQTRAPQTFKLHRQTAAAAALVSDSSRSWWVRGRRRRQMEDRDRQLLLCCRLGVVLLLV